MTVLDEHINHIPRQHREGNWHGYHKREQDDIP
jgi:hypothetical protein